MQDVYDHEMVRHNTEGVPYNPSEHVATKFRQNPERGSIQGEPLF